MTLDGPIYQERTGRCLARTVRVAKTLMDRLRGAIPMPPRSGEAVLLCGTAWVHSFGMRTSLHILYLDRTFRVVRIVRTLRPWRIAPPAPGACYALELAADDGVVDQIRRGDLLSMKR